MTGGSREYIVLSSREAYARAINDVESQGTSASGIQGYTVELGEHLYNGKLKLNSNAKDMFGRPSNNWQYDGKEIGTYVKGELLRKDYSVKVAGKDLYDLLTKNTIDTYDFVITVDGVEHKDTNAKTLLGSAWFDQANMIRSNTDGVGGTGKGVTTEVYVDTKDEVVYIAGINTYLAKADDEKDDELDLTVFNIDDKNGTRNPAAEIYTLYNDKGIVIAAATIESDGTGGKVTFGGGTAKSFNAEGLDSNWIAPKSGSETTILEVKTGVTGKTTVTWNFQVANASETVTVTAGTP